MTSDTSAMSSVFPCSLAEALQVPAKRLRIMNTPPAEADETKEVSSHHVRSAINKPDIVAGKEGALTASWARLLRQLREESDAVTQAGSNIIPTIQFQDLSNSAIADPFLQDLKTRGVGVIRGVIPPDEAAAWAHELDNYLRDNPHTQASPPDNPELYELFWSLAQLNARAHPNIRATQAFVMSGCWHHAPRGEHGRVSTRFPVVCADRVRMTHKSLRGSGGGSGRAARRSSASPTRAPVRVEPLAVEGCVGNRACGRIRAGEWESYDPWDSAARLDDRNGGGACAPSMFKMFLGMLPLSVGSTDATDDGNPPMRLCPLSLKLTTAYRLLRPLFSPKRGNALAGATSTDEFLAPSNWALNNASPVHEPRARHHAQRATEPPPTPPHLWLDDKTLVALPPLSPGDYVVWHPDTIFAPPRSPEQPAVAAAAAAAHCHPLDLDSDFDGGWAPARKPPRPMRPSSPTPTATLHLPCCPLTLANAAYLAHQRRAFILGFAPPAAGAAATITCGAAPGESRHMGRPGVQEINEAGGEEALRAMGLLAWDEDETADAGERRLLEGANAVLFSDRR